jgi:hypothetical protein
VNEIVIRGKQELAADAKVIEEYHEQKKIDGKDNRYQANQWLDRAGWKQNLSQYSEKELVEFVMIPQGNKKGPTQCWLERSMVNRSGEPIKSRQLWAR